MIRGTPISKRPSSVPGSVRSVEEPSSGERLLTTAEANDFLRRAKGFLEKRRSSGIDSPRYIQPVPRSPVRYRVVDLLEWEEGRMHVSSSELARPTNL